MKWTIVLPVALALLNTACHSYNQAPSSYSQAVSGLTKKRAGSLRNAGYSITTVDANVGCVHAKNISPLRNPPADVVKLAGAPIFLETNETGTGTGGNVTSTVTAYSTANNNIVSARKKVVQEASQKAVSN